MVAAQKHHPQRGHSEKQHDRADQHAAHDHRGERTLHLAADTRGNRRGKQTNARRKRRHQQGAHAGGCGAKHRVRWRAATKLRSWL